MGTFYAKRGNKVLKITEDGVERYLGQGYTITDVNGNIVKRGTPTDSTQLAVAYAKQEETIKALQAENAVLKKELESVKAELGKAKKAEPVEAEPKPTRKRKTTEAKEE